MEVATYQVHVQLLGLVPGRLTIHALVHLDSELAASRSTSVRGGECGVDPRAPHDEALLSGRKYMFTMPPSRCEGMEANDRA